MSNVRLQATIKAVFKSLKIYLQFKLESNTNLINGKLSYNLINFHLWELLLIICHGSWRKHNRRNGQINRTTILVKWNIQLPSSSSDVHLPQYKKEEWFYISTLSSQKWYTIFQLIIHIKGRLTIPSFESCSQAESKLLWAVVSENIPHSVEERGENTVLKNVCSFSYL